MLQAVRKHDGRIVAFEPRRLTDSLARAALSGGERPGAEGARRVAEEIVRAAVVFLEADVSSTPGTGDVREMVLRLLRETGHPKTAEAYAEHARRASSFLWRLRVVNASSPEGRPWDRRRLIEALLASGIARDPACEVARETERRLLALGQERISPALIHALAWLELGARSLDSRRYAAQRIAANFAALVPRYDAAHAERHPLPKEGPALAAFWLQAVHGPEVAQAAAHTLGLAPFPSHPGESGEAGEPLDPLLPETQRLAQAWLRGSVPRLVLRADDTARLTETARLLGASDMGGKARPGELLLWLGAPVRPETRAPRGVAQPVTLNAGSVLIREAVRDTEKATVRLAQLASVALQAHREREEYWGYSAVRGRELPIAAAGLWNAAAWLCGEPYERGAPSAPARQMAVALASSLSSAVITLRNETGIRLSLTAEVPPEAGRALWRADAEFLARDGLKLDPDGAYSGLELRIRPGMEDLAERVDFLRTVSKLFDLPTALEVDLPFGAEPDAAAWRQFFGALQAAGVPRVRAQSGGSGRGMKLLARQIRSHQEGFPLFAS